MLLFLFVVKLLHVSNVSVCLNYHLKGKIIFDCLYPVVTDLVTPSPAFSSYKTHY